MDKLKSYIYHLKTYDLVVVGFYIFLIVINIIFHNRIPQWSLFVYINLGVILLVLMLAYAEVISNRRFWRIVHYWYIVPIVYYTFKELYYLIEPIRQTDYDWLFIKIDRFMLGGDPTHFLHSISNPVLTEILQIVYSSFYLLPIFLVLFLLRKRRYLACDYAIFSIVFGFFVSYLGYFALPGIGPRFTLHNFAHINQDLPGLFLTKYLRNIIDTGESIPPGTLNPAAIVQRDVFPSGHTMITLIVMYLSIKLRSRSRFFFVPVGALLIFATVYLWYHYVIDLVGGAAFMMFSIWAGKRLFNWWRRKKGEEEFEYDKA